MSPAVRAAAWAAMQTAKSGRSGANRLGWGVVIASARSAGGGDEVSGFGTTSIERFGAPISTEPTLKFWRIHRKVTWLLVFLPTGASI